MNRRRIRWAWPLALVAALPFFPAHVDARSKQRPAHSLYKDGQAAEAREDYLAAYDDYSQAYKLNPYNLSYKVAYERVRFQAGAVHIHRGERLRDQGDYTGAITEFMQALEVDPSDELAKQDIEVTKEKVAGATHAETSLTNPGSVSELSGISSPVQLKPVSNEPITLHMTEDSKVIYQTVGKAAGINVLFDPDYTSKRVQIDLNNVSLPDALRILGAVTDTFWRPVTPNTIFVAQNTRAKRTELEEQAVQTFYLANASQQNDLNDVQTALRNVLTNAKLYAVPSQNAIVMRATPDELLLAQKLIDDLDKSRPEVVVDVAILEVSRNFERNLGITLPQQFSASLQPALNSLTNTATTVNNGTTNTGLNNGLGVTGTGTTGNGLTLNDVAHLNATSVALTISNAAANLLLNDTNTKVLQNPEIRATDGQKADLKVGSRIPVATGSFQTGAATAIVSSLVNTQFQYLDVGLEVEITPVVHYDRDVTLKLKAVVSQTNGSTNLGGVNEPIITQRTVDQTIRLKEGESNILGGLLQRTYSDSYSGTPGLASIPILKYIFGSNDHVEQTDEIVIMLTPHVVRGTELSPLNLREVDTGTGNTVELRRVVAPYRPSRIVPSVRPEVPGAEPQGPNPVAAMGPSGANQIAQGAQNPLPTQPTSTGQLLAGHPAVETPAPAGGAPVGGAPVGGAPAGGATAGGAPAAGGAAAAGAAAGANGSAAGSEAGAPANAAPGANPVSVQLSAPSVAPKVGSTFQVAVNVTGGKDLFAIPMQVQYDPSKLTLINVDAGEYLGHDGQAVALVHRDDGNGGVAISASRPPGVAGVNGGGQLCVLTFQAKAAGDSIVSVTKAAARNSQQQAVPVVTSGAIVHVQ
jgi:general secretion pathway protein D